MVKVRVNMLPRKRKAVDGREREHKLSEVHMKDEAGLNFFLCMCSKLDFYLPLHPFLVAVFEIFFIKKNRKF
ncbi:hypothetical protein ERO13_D03G055150v2 [Gossypium hirsutum]|nr:hypothetical protein ERO13_D03G055150v2 [Gossypium hirsutum]